MFSIILALILSFSSEAARRPAKAYPDEWSVSEYKILQVEYGRISAGKLERWLFQGPFAQRRRVLLAMARIGDPAFVEPVNRLLNSSRDSDLRRSAAFTLGSLEGEAAFLFASQNIPMHKDPLLVRELLIATGRTGNEKAVKQLSQFLKRPFSNAILEGACWGLGHAFTHLGSKAKEYETLKPVAELLSNSETTLSAAFALSRWQGDVEAIPVNAILAILPRVVSPSARIFLFRVLSKVRSDVVREALISAGRTSRFSTDRIEILKALGTQQPTDDTLKYILGSLTDASRHIQVMALQTAAKYRNDSGPLIKQIETLFVGSGSEWVRAEAILALIFIQPDLARKYILQNLKMSAGLVLRAFVKGLGLLGTPNDLVLAAEFLSSPHSILVQSALDGMQGLDEEQFTPLMKESIRIVVTGGDSGAVATAAELIEKQQWSSHLPALVESYKRFMSDDSSEIRKAIISVVGELGDESYVLFLESSLKDRYRIVAEAASRALKKLTNKDYPFVLNGTAAASLPSKEQLENALIKMVTIQTSRGDFTIRFHEDSPVSAFYFLKEAPKQKGRTFHRIVPNFVVQGGDPQGDGFGGPGYSIRDEITSKMHERGTVGIATAGKDTGGCQFFVNTALNPHLVGRYTNFGRVTSGIEVLDRLEPQDTILGVRVF